MVCSSCLFVQYHILALVIPWYMLWEIHAVFGWFKGCKYLACHFLFDPPYSDSCLLLLPPYELLPAHCVSCCWNCHDVPARHHHYEPYLSPLLAKIIAEKRGDSWCFDSIKQAELPRVRSIGHKLISMQRCRRDMPLCESKQMAHL